ncbi:hypothetical protein VTL71DRAFT_10687 [Oculimacula yallundae]|uniref:Uncharacterized protein n=1 Tax=Oculimacula yallundae TaxID=86028 RepID=A0ABR4CU86_9HELO
MKPLPQRRLGSTSLSRLAFLHYGYGVLGLATLWQRSPLCFYGLSSGVPGSKQARSQASDQPCAPLPFLSLSRRRRCIEFFEIMGGDGIGV